MPTIDVYAAAGAFLTRTRLPGISRRPSCVGSTSRFPDLPLFATNTAALTRREDTPRSVLANARPTEFGAASNDIPGLWPRRA